MQPRIYLTEAADVRATLESLNAYQGVISSIETGLTFEDVKKLVRERPQGTPVCTRYFHLLVTYGAWFSGVHVEDVSQEQSATNFQPGDMMLLHGHQKDEWCKVVFRHKHENVQHPLELSSAP